MAIEIVDFPIEHGGSFHSYVKLPEGKAMVEGYPLGSVYIATETSTVLNGKTHVISTGPWLQERTVTNYQRVPRYFR